MNQPPKHLTFRTGDRIELRTPDGHTIAHGTFIDRHTITTGGIRDTQALIREDGHTWDSIVSFETIRHA